MDNMNQATEEQQKVLRRNQILASLNQKQQQKEKPKPQPAQAEPEPDPGKKGVEINIKINKNAILGTLAFLVLFTIVVFPKVNLVTYKSINGTVETFYVTSDILGFHDSKLLDTSYYEDIEINDRKQTISFCSKIHKNVECYNTRLIERKGFFASFGSYIAYINKG